MGDLLECTKGRINRNITFCFIVRVASDSFFFFVQLHNFPYTAQTFSACLYVSIYLPLSLFLHRVKRSFILELLLCFKKAQ